MISQPAAALAYGTEALAAGEYAPSVAGLSLIKSAPGVWLATLDKGMPEDRIVVVATPVHATNRVSSAITFNGATNGLVSAFTISTVDNTGAAVDTGITVAVFEIPDLT